MITPNLDSGFEAFGAEKRPFSNQHIHVRLNRYTRAELVIAGLQHSADLFVMIGTLLLRDMTSVDAVSVRRAI